MKKYACRYALVQFVPYSEAGEFANVGVVLICPEPGYFNFQLQTRKSARVTAFFDKLKPAVYLTAIKVIQGELARIGEAVANAPSAESRASYRRELFSGLVHPREAIVRFGTPRAVLTDSPKHELKRLFDHYVAREQVFTGPLAYMTREAQD